MIMAFTASLRNRYSKSFRRREKRRGFGPYLQCEPLEVRRVLSADWSIPLSNDDGSYIQSLTVDEGDDTYAAISFLGSLDVDPLGGGASRSSRGDVDAVVAKYDPTGQLIWSYQFGGTGWEDVNGIAYGANGLVVVTARYTSTQIDVDNDGMADEGNNGGRDAIVITLDAATGDVVRWTAFGGPDDEHVEAVAVGASGNVFASGSFSSTVDFDRADAATPGEDTLTAKASKAGYVLALAPDGSFSAVWEIDGHRKATVDIGGIAADSAGVVLVGDVAGGSVDLDPSAASRNIDVARGHTDGFVASYSPTGDLQWANEVETSSTGRIFGYFESRVAIDNGQAFVGGNFRGTVTIHTTSGSTSRTSHGKDDLLLAAFDVTASGGGELNWAHAIGGPEGESFIEVALDDLGNVVVAGSMSANVDFDPSAGEWVLSSVGIRDNAMARYSPTGQFLNAWRWGNLGGDAGASWVAASPDGVARVGAQTNKSGGGTVLVFPNGTQFVHDGGPPDQTFNDSWITTIDLNGPNVRIAQPTPDASIPEGQLVTLSAQAMDAQDGDISASIAWSSSVDGFLATGPTAEVMMLSLGAHRITAAATDSDGKVQIATTVIEVTEPPAPTDANDIYVWDIGFDIKSRGPNTDYYILVDVQSDSDADGLASSTDAGAGGVLVTVELRDESGNLVDTYSGTTDADGVFTSDKIRNLASGNYTAEVIDLAHETYDWNTLLDNESDTDFDGLPDEGLIV